MRSLAIVGAVSLLTLLAVLPPVNAQDQAQPDPLLAAEEALGLTEDEVKRVLAALDERGFDTGAADGKLASSARAAIRGFQRAIGWPQTGYLDGVTAALLLTQPRAHPLIRLMETLGLTTATTQEPPPLSPSSTVALPMMPIVVPQPQCTAASSSMGCWMKIVEDGDCYVWNPGPKANETAAWDGPCEDGKGHGYGMLRWRAAENASEEKKEWLTAKGLLEEGLPYGYWNLTYTEGGGEIEVEFLDGGRLYRARARGR